MKSKLLMLALASMGAMSCGETTTGGTDSGTNQPVADAGVRDAGTTQPVADAGTVVDAGTSVHDAGTPPVVDAGTAGDAGVVFNNCDDAAFTDSSANTNTDVLFGGALGHHYSPACVLISVGHTVTFKGAFSSHPLAPGTQSNPAAGSPSSPILSNGAGSADDVITFNVAGDYPYYCGYHAGEGMAGVVRVR